jgi:hypothetical protein
MTGPAEDLHLAEVGRPVIAPTRQMDGEVIESAALRAVGMEPPRFARDLLPLS